LLLTVDQGAGDKMAELEVPKKLWEHPDPKSTEMYRFMQEVNQKYKLNLKVGAHHITAASHCDEYE
jgi:hypothetical protein